MILYSVIFSPENELSGMCMAFKNFGPKGLKWDACAKPIIFKPTIIHRFMTVILCNNVSLEVN